MKAKGLLLFLLISIILTVSTASAAVPVLVNNLSDRQVVFQAEGGEYLGSFIPADDREFNAKAFSDAMKKMFEKHSGGELVFPKILEFKDSPHSEVVFSYYIYVSKNNKETVGEFRLSLDSSVMQDNQFKFSINEIAKAISLGIGGGDIRLLMKRYR